MPRAFLVKKPCVSTCKRNWSELPDEERGEIYVPGEARPAAPPSLRRPRGRGRGPGQGAVRAPCVRGAAARGRAGGRTQPGRPI